MAGVVGLAVPVVPHGGQEELLVVGAEADMGVVLVSELPALV
jgi:hypothetical protein